VCFFWCFLLLLFSPLATVLVNVRDSNRITCTLFGSETGGASTEEYLSTVMQRYGGRLLQVFIRGENLI